MDRKQGGEKTHLSHSLNTRQVAVGRTLAKEQKEAFSNILGEGLKSRMQEKNLLEQERRL